MAPSCKHKIERYSGEKLHSCQSIGWVSEKDRATMGAVEKPCHLPNFHTIIDSTSTKHMYIKHKFTKVTTFIIKNNYKNCYLGKVIREGSLV